MFFQMFCRTNGTLLEIAATIRAYAAEIAFDAVTTESALKGANHGFSRTRWQVSATAFAFGSQLQHDV